jgi:tRNA(Ile)-lysidine synthase TilS/MesJ
MLNMMFNGSLSAMPAKLASGDGRNTVIRPLLYSSERDIAAYSEELDFPIIPCNLCGSQDNLWRQQVKEMLDDIEKRAPQVRQSMLAALKNVHTSHLLGTSSASARRSTGSASWGCRAVRPPDTHAGTSASSPGIRIGRSELDTRTGPESRSSIIG